MGGSVLLAFLRGVGLEMRFVISILVSNDTREGRWSDGVIQGRMCPVNGRVYEPMTRSYCLLDNYLFDSREITILYEQTQW